MGYRFLGISMSDFFWILQIPGSGYNIGGINGSLHVIVAPHTVNLPPYIGVSVPPFVIVFTHFRIPLSHGVVDTFLIHATSTPNLERDLSFEFHVKYMGRIG